MAQTLTAAAEPDHAPPRVRLDFSDTGAAPATAVTITRQDADGRSYPVRTADGGPLPVSGGVATIYDYEPPFGRLLSYSTDLGQSATALLDVRVVWLIHPGVPVRSVAVETVVDLGERTASANQGVFQVLGRSTPIVVNGGPRSAPAGTLTLRTKTLAQRDALLMLLSGADPLFLNVPPATGWGVDPCYIAVGDVTETRTLDFGPFPWREWTLPYQQVARPGGGTQAAITWETVAAKYATWKAIADAGVTSWAELAAPTA